LKHPENCDQFPLENQISSGDFACLRPATILDLLRYLVGTEAAEAPVKKGHDGMTLRQVQQSIPVQIRRYRSADVVRIRTFQPYKLKEELRLGA
jgi:hypothetical protein